ncbi:MAG: RnfABCDGE type electron transport complex subunit D [Clostridia bacterium]|nr:RnfABCDGE type electron transport complex subunit D [Clostridia bacterium]
MSALTKVMVSPHIHSGRSTAGIMRDVLIALLPATVAGTLIFGWRSLLVVAVCIVSCVAFEALFNVITKKDYQTVGDLSAAVTGMLLALNLPVNVPIWQCVVGSLFAIVVVKCLFGGIGLNLVNPAMTARVFMLVAFGALAQPAFPVDAVAGATPLSAEQLPSLLTLFLGNYGGAIGETCTAALLLGGLYLLVRRVITWQIPVVFMATVFVFSFFMEGFDAVRAVSMVMSGGVCIGAFYMATDYTTSPPTAWGKAIFGLGCGLLTCLIRYFGIYPEGVSFAILFMNILTPYIVRWTRYKVFAGGSQP